MSKRRQKKKTSEEKINETINNPTWYSGNTSKSMENTHLAELPSDHMVCLVCDEYIFCKKVLGGNMIYIAICMCW